ncbi:MAG: metal-sensing transcriptional repressor [Oscillospiraceae bacterium]|nr:metal-sensing transcriptional repressor [Oscillospiraceae bacterium]
MDHSEQHEHVHHHGHVHDPKEKRRQINRLSRVIGHLEYVKRMIENDEDCAAVLMQVSATRSALNGLGKEIINEHISHCIAHAVEEGDTEAIEEFKTAIQKYL